MDKSKTTRTRFLAKRRETLFTHKLVAIIKDMQSDSKN